MNWKYVPKSDNRVYTVNRLLALLLLAASAVLFVAAGCRTPAPPSAIAPIVASGFVGNAACADCHATECRSMAATRHAHTLREATRSALGELSPPLGPVPLAGYEIAERNGRFEIARQYPSPEAHPLEYALGSGKTGMTYVSLVGDKLLEAKLSYFPHSHAWETTPGQEIPQEGTTIFGRIRDVTESRRCLSCHAVALSDRATVSAPGFYGVGCESCHGPGKAHVTAMQSGKAGDIHMERLGRLSSTKLNDLCGKCHRTLQQIAIDTPMIEETHRFQPYGLTRSRCREASQGPLSCLLCHNAHQDSSTDRGHYNAVCLDCHSGATQPKRAAHSEFASSIKAGRVCPVNATEKCIDCHMRPKKTFMISTFPGTMVDHHISVPDQRRKP